MDYTTPPGFIKCPECNIAIRITAIVAFRPSISREREVISVWCTDGEEYTLYINAETLSRAISDFNLLIQQTSHGTSPVPAQAC